VEDTHEILLEVKDLHTSFFTEDGEVKAVDGIDFVVEKGKTLGIVGESGSGKSVTSLSIMRLLEGTTATIPSGEILYDGKDLLKMSNQEMMRIRGNHISMVFQEPMTSLNPTMTCGEQIAEPIRTHRKLSRKDAWDSALRMLKRVGMPEPEKRARQYPFELSGGMRQRVMIAMALSCHPDLLIADEPTTALDVTIQAQILDLIKRLQREFGTSMIMITHDLGVIAEVCDKVAVMYCGKIVEYTDTYTLFTDPKHPYTVGLMKSIPSHEADVEGDLNIIRGTLPSPNDRPKGCLFAPRCPYMKDICNETPPELLECGEDRTVRCFIYQLENWEGDRP